MRAVRAALAITADWLRHPSLTGIDRPWLRARIVDMNDGVIATAGVVEGFVAAEANWRTILTAAMVLLIAGGVSIAGAKYVEAATERDAELALIEEERHRLEEAPEEEREELVQLFEERGISRHVAEQVADELMARDALAAHADLEHGISLAERAETPLVTGIASGLAFAVGALVPTLAVAFAPSAWRGPVTAVAVLVALLTTSLLTGAAGGTHPARAAARTIGVALFALLLTSGAGNLVD